MVKFTSMYSQGGNTSIHSCEFHNQLLRVYFVNQEGNKGNV